MGFDPMTHRPRTDIFSSFSHLLALANLKDIMETHSWDEQAVKLQAEMAKLQYLQYLLQPNSNINNTTTALLTDIDTINLLNSLSSSSPDNIAGGGSMDSLIHLNNSSIPFSHMPDLQASYQTTPTNNKDSTPAAQEFPVLSQLTPAAASFATPSPPSMVGPVPETSSINNLGDVCSTSSCYGGAPPSIWPELLLEDPLFHEIA